MQYHDLPVIFASKKIPSRAVPHKFDSAFSFVFKPNKEDLIAQAVKKLEHIYNRTSIRPLRKENLAPIYLQLRLKNPKRVAVKLKDSWNTSYNLQLVEDALYVFLGKGKYPRLNFLRLIGDIEIDEQILDIARTLRNNLT